MKPRILADANFLPQPEAQAGVAESVGEGESPLPKF
jgi:hypothetical protein